MSFINIEALNLEQIYGDFQKAVIDNSTPKNILLFSLGLSTSYIVYKIFGFYLKRRKYRHIPGPQAKGFLGIFVGNAPEIESELKKGKVLPEVLSKWQEIYGDVFKFQLYNKIIVVTSDKNTIKEALITKNFPKDISQTERIGLPMGERFLGNGLVTELDNEKWRQRRALFNPGFHRHVLITFVDHFNQIVNTLSEKLRARADGKTVVVLGEELNRATLDAIALIAFGMNTDAVTSDESILNRYLINVLQTCFKNFIFPLFRYQPSKQKEVKEFRKMVHYIRDTGRNKIMERINAFKNNEHMPDDILSSILSSSKDSELDIELMTDDFATFFVAGQETTANTLAFCFLEIGKNPEIAKKAREEIDRVLGERTEVTFQDVAELKYCSAIFKEALRLFPPAPQVNRRVPEEIDINGIKIPKDSPLWISPFVNGRIEKYFKNSKEFKPERFLKSENNEDSNIDSYIYLPFSLGPRNCIGQNFAQLEGVIVLAKLLQKFDFKLDPTQPFGIEQILTLKPKGGTRVFVSLRK